MKRRNSPALSRVIYSALQTASFAFLPTLLIAADVTIPSGAQFTAAFSLREYNNVCSAAVSCPTFPAAIMPGLSVRRPAGLPADYSITMSVASTNNGAVIPIGQLPLELTTDATTHEVSGLFRYNGGLAGFPFPSDPSFWNADPKVATFLLIVKNTGGPITLQGDPAQAVFADLDTSTSINGSRIAAAALSATAVEQPQLSAPRGASNVPAGPTTLAWAAAAGAASYDVYFGTTPNPPFVGNVPTPSYTTAALAGGGTYYWKVIANNGLSFTPSEVRSFNTVTGLGFVAIPPCRALDTRITTPALSAGATRTLALPATNCGIPSTAKAYSLNVTVVPNGPLAYLTAWPSGQPFPLASTLNALDGAITANAAVIPAGTDGAVSFYATNSTHLVVDVNGYFTTDTASNLFFPLAPCRVADTRSSGGPIDSSATRDFFPIASACAAPSSATAYSLNVTAVPNEPLGYLSLWPSGQSFPNVSTTNSLDARVIANAAIVPAGTNGAIRAGASNRTDVVLDINGVFAPRAANGLQFYPMQPCRTADTRVDPGGVMASQATRAFNPSAGPCPVPTGAQAYSVNVTVVPREPLGYLSLWPAGQYQPFVSTLNALKGNIVANAAIVPAGSSGAISVYVTNNTDVILDVNGFFAP